MVQALRIIGFASIVGGIIMGIIVGTQPDPLLQMIDPFYEKSFRWAAAVSWWLGGIISGIVFLAYARILELQEENRGIVRWIAENMQTKSQENKGPASDSRASLSKLSGFTLGGSKE